MEAVIIVDSKFAPVQVENHQKQHIVTISPENAIIVIDLDTAAQNVRKKETTMPRSMVFVIIAIKRVIEPASVVL